MVACFPNRGGPLLVTTSLPWTHRLGPLGTRHRFFKCRMALRWMELPNGIAVAKGEPVHLPSRYTSVIRDIQKLFDALFFLVSTHLQCLHLHQESGPQCPPRPSCITDKWNICQIQNSKSHSWPPHPLEVKALHGKPLPSMKVNGCNLSQRASGPPGSIVWMFSVFLVL